MMFRTYRLQTVAAGLTCFALLIALSASAAKGQSRTTSLNSRRKTSTPAPNPHPLAPSKIEFNRDIRPVLSDNCFACHGPNHTARQAGLRFDEREVAVQMGAIVPGHPEKSLLVARIQAVGATQMPPVTSHKTLTAAQKATLIKWIAQGATYEVFWAYQPLRRPAVPHIASTPKFTVRGPIDAYILQKLKAKGISPSYEADKRTLIRRVSLDLIGLPPTPAEVSAFLADTSPGAYDKLVDRLIASPHYGERMAIPWLDEVRYADTVGFHGDQNMNAWAYRDYVINSFNKNKPFDKFTIEQLAGDLLPNPTPEQLTATCFNRLNMVTREGGAQPKEYLAKYVADRVRTVSMTFLGSTFACAECHDHKYDPISTKDFYSLGAFFADMKQWGVSADYGYTPNPDLKGYNNDSPFPPEIKVDSPYLIDRISRQRARIADIAAHAVAGQNNDSLAQLGSWIKGSQGFLAKHPDGWELPPPTVSSSMKQAKPKPKTASATSPEAPGPAFQMQSDGSVLLTDSAAGNLTLDLHPESPRLASLKLELLPTAANGNTVFGKGRDSADVTLSVNIVHADGSKQPVAFRYAGANFSEPEYANGFEIIGVQRGWKPSKAHSAEVHVSTWLPDKPYALHAGDTLDVTLPDISAGCVRVSISPFVPERPDAPTLPQSLSADLAALQTQLSGVRTASLNTPSLPAAGPGLTQYLEGTAWNSEAFAQVKAIEADIFGCREGKTPVMVTEAIKTPLQMRVLPRGNWFDDSGEVVEPAIPHFLPQSGVPTGRRLTRLDLARWMVSPENPLTARTYVNRLWKQFFGNGISGLVEDLGAQGENPTHPELLDWLASEFRDSGWNIKHMVRLMVTSSTYRQESKLRPELKELDPGNRLLESQNPRRLEAELVRDNALSIAGMLNQDIGGPPCFPYQPAGYYVNIQFPDRHWISDTDDREYRRGIYIHWQRTFMHPMLANFDAPSREDCTANRVVSNTPQQALTLLNDPEFTEPARVLATKLVATVHGSDAARLDALFQRALARSPRENEKRSLLDFLASMRSAYKARPEDAAKLLAIGNTPPPTAPDKVELAAWTSVCRVVLNLHETITRY